MTTPKMKVCTKCGQMKRIPEDYGKPTRENKRGDYSYHPYCLQCRAELESDRRKSKPPEYSIWGGLFRRCVYTKRAREIKYWKGRGIHICERWLKFENFLADMGPRPTGPDGRKMTLDRIDNNKGYEPGNCRWATWAQQERNKRNNVRLTHAGRTQCITEWAEELGICKVTIQGRLYRGWSVERTLTEPIQTKKRNRFYKGLTKPK